VLVVGVVVRVVVLVVVVVAEAGSLDWFHALGTPWNSCSVMHARPSAFTWAHTAWAGGRVAKPLAYSTSMLFRPITWMMVRRPLRPAWAATESAWPWLVRWGEVASHGCAGGGGAGGWCCVGEAGRACWGAGCFDFAQAARGVVPNPRRRAVITAVTSSRGPDDFRCKVDTAAPRVHRRAAESLPAGRRRLLGGIVRLAAPVFES
jgi:hypothetical protein